MSGSNLLSFEEVELLDAQQTEYEKSVRRDRGIKYYKPKKAPEKIEFNGVREALDEHQKTNLDWMLRRACGGEFCEGGILADQQGLGKTISALAYMFYRAICYNKCKRDEKVLMILRGNCNDAWFTDLQKLVDLTGFAVSVLIINSRTHPEDFDESDIIIVTPEMLRSCYTRRRESSNRSHHPETRFLLSGAEKRNKEAKGLNGRGRTALPIDYKIYDTVFGDVFTDEADFMRNGAKRLAFLCNTAILAKRRWCLTGTPLHTKFSNLEALFRAIGVKEDDVVRRSEAVLNAVMMRHTRAQIAEVDPTARLPPKKEITEVIFMEGEELKTYTMLHKNAMQAALRIRDGSATEFDTVSLFTRRVLRLLQFSSAGKIMFMGESAKRELEITGDVSDLPEFIHRIMTEDQFGWQSAKMRRAIMLEEKHKRDRILFFSRSVSTLDVLHEALTKSGVKNVLRYDGSVSQVERQAILDKVKSDSDTTFRLLISSGSGSSSLNLQSFNVEVLMEPEYDPSVREQCVYRVWRRGQKKSVTIYHLVVSGTAEVRVHEISIEREEFNATKLDKKVPKNATAANVNTFIEQFSLEKLRTREIRQIIGSVLEDDEARKKAMEDTPYWMTAPVRITNSFDPEEMRFRLADAHLRQGERMEEFRLVLDEEEEQEEGGDAFYHSAKRPSSSPPGELPESTKRRRVESDEIMVLRNFMNALAIVPSDTKEYEMVCIKDVPELMESTLQQEVSLLGTTNSQENVCTYKVKTNGETSSTGNSTGKNCSKLPSLGFSSTAKPVMIKKSAMGNNVLCFNKERDLMSRVAGLKELGGTIMAISPLSVLVRHFQTVWPSETTVGVFRMLYFRDSLRLMIIHPKGLVEPCK